MGRSVKHRKVNVKKSESRKLMDSRERQETSRDRTGKAMKIKEAVDKQRKVNRQ